MIKLSINVDHIATLREARGGKEPDPIKGALICEKAGADGITFHLREDRRHIQDKDVLRLRKSIRHKLNMEMAGTAEMVEIAKRRQVDQVTIVPEKRKEITTEGGLDVYKQKIKLGEIVRNLKSKKILVSFFINPELMQVKASSRICADAIEIHTGRYSDTDGKKRTLELKKIKEAADFAASLGLKVFAGHGLNYKNVIDIANIHTIEELNIGYSIIAEAVFTGLYSAVKNMKELLK